MVDMSASNSWADFAGIFRQTRAAHEDHEAAKANLKKLMPEDAKEALGHGLRAKRYRPGRTPRCGLRKVAAALLRGQ